MTIKEAMEKLEKLIRVISANTAQITDFRSVLAADERCEYLCLSLDENKYFVLIKDDEEDDD